MTTLVRITDPQQARDYYEAGILLWGSAYTIGRVETADSSWMDGSTDLEDAVLDGSSHFFIRLED